jgi:hypothetical protein
VRANLLAALIGMLCVVGCGGGGSVNGGGGGTPTGANVATLTVDSGPSAVASSNSPAVNTLYTTVTICVPGTSTCQTIDHIEVDTGSSGLRIISSELAISLPLQTNSSGNTIGECVGFVDGSSWGIVRLADVKIAGESASNLPVQIIGDAAFAPPSGCTANEDTVGTFGARGILGVGPFIQDCGSSCTVPTNTYFTCTNTNATTPCSPAAMPLAMQVSNPVASFAAPDNNGVIIKLDSLSGTAASVGGSLIFGIGTQGNNGLGGAKVLTLDSAGRLTTDYKTSTLDRSFIDSGSNAYYFPDTTIKSCPDGSVAPKFFCPGSTLSLSGTIVGANGATAIVNFVLADAVSLFTGKTTVAAAAGLGAPITSVNSGSSDLSHTFDWGLPFYYGRSVYTAIENQNTSGGLGPYFAF